MRQGRARAWARRSAAALLGLAGAALVLDLVFPLPEAARFTASASGRGAVARPAPARDHVPNDSTFVVLAADGTPLRTWPTADGALRHPVTLQAVSPLYLQALLHYEDRWFRLHPGVNPVALLRAAWQWVRHGRIVSGGSTLTMQVARLIDPPSGSRQSLSTKLRQIARALQLEWHLSKDEILLLYLHRAPMGGQVEGVEMASRAYLGKESRQLSHAEAALLVALPQSPSRLRPDRAPGRAQQARDKVLVRMQDLGVWPAEVVQEARVERVFAPPLRARWIAPLLAERLRRDAGGLRLEMARAEPRRHIMQSTLDAAIQLSLERILLDRVAHLPEKVSIAALVMDNETLAVKGYAGSADFTDNTRAAHVDMVQGVRSPGSTLKPFLYAMALDEGLVHSESLLIDAPQNFGGYAPGNFQASFTGAVSVSEALQRSLNVPAVDLLDRIGPARFAAHLRHAGVRLRMPAAAEPNLSLILGGGGTTLEELVGAYRALAHGGVAGRPRLTPAAPVVETRLMSPGAAFIVREILENGGRPEAPFREGAERIAWKTGTSFGFRDAWAVGVTDRYTVGVWVGRPDGTPNPGYFGANTAAPLVKDVLMALGRTGGGARARPPTVQAADICWPLGLAAQATPAGQCRVRRAAWTLEGATPPTLPDRIGGGGLQVTAWVDEQRHQRLDPRCLGAEAGRLRPVAHVRWPTLLRPWLDADMLDPVERLPLAAACRVDEPRRALHVAGVEPGSVLRALPGRQGVRVKVQALGTEAPVTWLLNGRVVGSSDGRSPSLQLALSRVGEQALTALDTQGRYERVVFTLR